jgi:hypothetical protein
MIKFIRNHRVRVCVGAPDEGGKDGTFCSLITPEGHRWFIYRGEKETNISTSAKK